MTSSMVTDCAGFVPHVTVGRNDAASSTTSLSKDAPGSVARARHDSTAASHSAPVRRELRPRRYSNVTSSGAIIPARAPASIDMLQTVIRPSIDSARIAAPRYSMIEPIPPPVPIWPMIASTMSLAVHARRHVAVDGDRHRARTRLRQRLRGEHVLDLARADAERERAERAVRRRVAVAAHDGHARLREALLRADHVHDALARLAHRVADDPELVAVLRQHLHLLRGDRVRDRQVDVTRWARCGPSVAMVRSGRRTRAPGEAQPVERLG